MLSRREILTLLIGCFGASVAPFDVLAQASNKLISQSAHFLELSYYLTGFSKVEAQLTDYYQAEIEATFGKQQYQLAQNEFQRAISEHNNIKQLQEVLLKHNDVYSQIINLWYLGHFKVTNPSIDIRDLAYRKGLVWQLIMTTPPAVPSVQDWSEPPKSDLFLS
ncbi:sugar dehydrogenase complex small subunit [Parashewanella tropica]|uniref:sugar dehydrogenase complex small subunit n=1 Tax=Parashewanella tropica TaxID=2547970 RepID=UPI001059E095|nr:sugar dehydrogenase complex small subunit [Parashewanella tropica]